MRTAALLVVIVLSATGCLEPSQVAADADIVVTGEVVRADGSPARDARVGLSKEIGFAEAIDGMFTVFSMGTVCLVQNPPELCARFVRPVELDSGGRFSIDLSGRDVQSLFGFASTMSLAAALPARSGERAGPSTTYGFKVQTGALPLPPLRFWEDPLRVGADPATVSVAWDPLPETLGTPERYTAAFEDARAATVWQAPGGGSVAVDARLLEDLAAGVAVQAEVSDVVPGSTMQVMYRSAAVAVQGPGAPPSRGRPCTVAFEGGQPIEQVPCTLTDGDMANPGPSALPPGGPAPGPACPPDAGPDCGRPVAVLDLGTAQAWSLLVLRGAIGPLSLSVSDDGAAWRPAGEYHVSEEFVAVPLSGVAGRYLRISAPAVLALREVSVW